MKQSNFTIQVDDEKLSALKRYMERKNMSLDRELVKAFEKLYARHVPSQVREYIEDMEGAELPRKPRAAKCSPGDEPVSRD